MDQVHQMQPFERLCRTQSQPQWRLAGDSVDKDKHLDLNFELIYSSGGENCLSLDEHLLHLLT